MGKTLAIRGVRRLGGKPAKTGGDVDAAAKERPEEAPFAALRPHDSRLRTWSRAPAAKPTRPKNNSKKLRNNHLPGFGSSHRTRGLNFDFTPACHIRKWNFNRFRIIVP